jgi:hypothetical protein
MFLAFGPKARIIPTFMLKTLARSFGIPTIFEAHVSISLEATHSLIKPQKSNFRAKSPFP